MQAVHTPLTGKYPPLHTEQLTPVPLATQVAQWGWKVEQAAQEEEEAFTNICAVALQAQVLPLGIRVEDVQVVHATAVHALQ